MPRPGLIFDLDGTLIDSAPDIHAVANRVLSQRGLTPLPFDQVKGFIGNGVSVLIARCLAAHGKPAAPDDIASLAAVFELEYETAVHLTTLAPGVKEGLQALADASISMAICTNKPTAPTRAVLRHFELLHHFPVIVGGDTMALRKPDPAPLIHAHKMLGSQTIIFVGDSEVDAETGQRAGARFWLYANGYRKAAAETLGAEWIFDDFRDLARRLTVA